MDPQNQKLVLDVAKRYPKNDVIVILGSPDPESASIAAETVMLGDPTYAGPLAGVPLGLRVYHVTEPAVKEVCDPAVYEEQIGLMGAVLDAEGIAAAVEAIRQQAGAS